MRCLSLCEGKVQDVPRQSRHSDKGGGGGDAPGWRGNKYGGGVSGLTVMLSDRGRTMGWNCQKEYSVSLKKMLVITVLTLFNGVLGRVEKN